MNNYIMNNSPQPKKIKMQPYKLNNLALQMPTPLQKSGLKQFIGSGPVSKPKQDERFLLVKHPNNLEMINKANPAYSFSQDHLIQEYRKKVDEYDAIIRLQEFKIGRLQSELQLSRNQYQRLASKMTQYEQKMHYYLQIPSPQQPAQSQPVPLQNSKTSSQNKSGLQLPQMQMESMPSLAKLLNMDSVKQKKLTS